MSRMICSRCMEVFLDAREENCAKCGKETYDFTNDDAFLLSEAKKVREARNRAGLGGLVRGLDAIIINTEPDHQQPAAQEFLDTTGYRVADAFENDGFRVCVLKLDGSADILVQSRKGPSPFEPVSDYPKARHLPSTRLETYVFSTPDLDRYVSIQRDRGVNFMTDDTIETDACRFIQTVPSTYTGFALGFVEWKQDDHDYRTAGSESLDWRFDKPDWPHLRNIGLLDHTATRLEARDRDPAIIEFMNLTNYNFDFSVYVRRFNSITNVARLSEKDFAMVFTSGVRPYISDEESGPTEKFVRNYGKRVHHMAFHTEGIQDTFRALKDHGMEFLVELVGNEQEGLRQTFSEASPHTLLVNEYIYRYGDFDGFFTMSNVTRLTEATDKQ